LNVGHDAGWLKVLDGSTILTAEINNDSLVGMDGGATLADKTNGDSFEGANGNTYLANECNGDSLQGSNDSAYLVVNNDVNSLDKVGIDVNSAADYDDISSDEDGFGSIERTMILSKYCYILLSRTTKKGKYECQ